MPRAPADHPCAPFIPSHTHPPTPLLPGVLYSAELAPLAGTALLVRPAQGGGELAVEAFFPTLLRCTPLEGDAGGGWLDE